MDAFDFPRNVTSMRLMAEMAVDEGMSMRECLAGTGVRESQLTDPDLLVSGQQELRQIRNIVAALGSCPALGVQAGRRYHFTAFGALGFALVSSRNARAALDIALQYFQLTCALTRFAVSDTEFETHVVVADHELPKELAAFIVERDIAALTTVARDLYGTQPLLRHLALKRAAPADTDPYEAYFGARPLFGAAVNRVALDRIQLEQPLLQANEPARRAAIDQCRRLIETRKARTGLAATVRSRLLTASAQMPTMEAVAVDLCMTQRTLRRRLLDERTTFAELRDEVRQMLADEFLDGPRLSVEQIAERLGYAEPTSFINAFRRWHGQTPHAFRLAKRGRQEPGRPKRARGLS